MKYNNSLMRSMASAILTVALAVPMVNPITASAADSLFDEWDYQHLSSRYTRLAEKLDRGVVAVKTDSGVFISWRLNGYESENAKFNLYRDNELITSEPIYLTNYTDEEGTSDSVYSVGLVVDGEETERSENAEVLENQYKEIKLASPPPVTTKAIEDDRNPPVELDEPAVFTPNDTSVADLNGDGKYDFVIKLVPSNQNDAMPNIADKTYLDGYTSEGEHLWRIDIGPNIRTQRHGIQPIVYDFDGDGKAEIAVITGDGAVSLRPNADGNGTYGTFGGFDSDPETYGTLDANYDVISVIGDPREVGKSAGKGRWTTDESQYYLNQTGPLYLSVFDGETGEEIQTIPYDPQTSHEGYEIAVNGYSEGPITVDGFTFEGYALPDGAMPVNSAAENGHKSWSSTYPNHPWRMNAAVAYLDGETPGMIFQRGIYSGRVALSAYTLEKTSDGKRHIVQEWRADSYDLSDTGGQKGTSGINAQGYHNVSVGDLDGSGKDSIIIGSSAVKYDGTLLWTTGRGHGDAQHLGKYDPDSKGYQFMGVHERGKYGFSLLNAEDGSTIWRMEGTEDTGRGIIGIWGDFDGAYAELSASNDCGSYVWNGGSGSSAFTDASGKGFPSTANSEGVTESNANYRIYWDGDLWDEAMDGYDPTGTTDRDMEYGIWSYDESTGQMERIFETEGCATIDFTKKPPLAVADIFGDWREEFIARTADNSAIRIYTTVEPTDYRYYTFMHDALYRVSAARQCSGYNQPPHIGFYLADRDGQRDLQPNANIYLPSDYAETVYIDSEPETDLVAMKGEEYPTLSVEAKTENGSDISYQWYEASGTANEYSRRPADTGTAIDGATDSEFKIPDDVTPGKHYYYCVVSANGARTKTSYAAKVTAYERPIIEFTEQPSNAMTVHIGDIDADISAKAEVKPSGNVTYQWYRAENASGKGGAAIEGATDETLTIPTDLKLGTYYYYCLASADDAESVKSNVTAVTVEYDDPNKFYGNNFTDTSNPWLTDKAGASAGLTATVVTDPENKIGGVVDSCLRVSGGGTGGRAIAGTVDEPDSDEKIYTVQYDVNFGTMTNGYVDVGIWPTGTTDVMSTAPIFKLTRTSSNELYWSVNTTRGQHTGSGTKILEFSSSDDVWIRTKITLDYETGTGTVTLTSLNSDASYTAQFSLDGAAEGIGKFGVAASRSSGTMSVSLDIANVSFSCGTAQIVTDPNDLQGDAKNIALNLSTLSMNTGDEKRLLAYVTPYNSADSAVTWSSSDESIASVDELGLITALSEGETIITAAVGDLSAECVVNVGGSPDATPSPSTVPSISPTPSIEPSPSALPSPSISPENAVSTALGEDSLNVTDKMISGDISFVINNTGDDRTADVMFAIYHDGILKTVKKQTAITLSSGDTTAKFSGISVPYEGNYTYKLFVWDENMIPLCNAYTGNKD